MAGDSCCTFRLFVQTFASSVIRLFMAKRFINNQIQAKLERGHELASSAHVSRRARNSRVVIGRGVNENQSGEEEVSKTWSHGPHSEIPVLRSRFDSCGSRGERLSGSTADYRTVTVMFHMWRQTLSPGRRCRCRSASAALARGRHAGTRSRPREATAEVLTSKMIVSIWASLL